MGFFGNMFSSFSTQPATNEADAFFEIVAASIAAEGDVAEEEINSLLAFMMQKNALKNIDDLNTYNGSLLSNYPLK